MKVALIIKERVHEIMDFSVFPTNFVLPDGTKPLFIDVTGKDVHEGDKYNPLTKHITKRPSRPEELEEWHGYLPRVYWNEEEFEWVLDYVASVQTRIDHILTEIASRDYRAWKAIKLNLPLEELYPGEGAWYQAKIAELHAAQDDMDILTGPKEPPPEEDIIEANDDPEEEEEGPEEE